MIEILSVIPNGFQYHGYVRMGGNYYKFQTDPLGVNYTPFPGEFRNYEHFAGAVGKFNPWYFFLKTPIQVEELTMEFLMSLNLDFHSRI